MTSSSPPAPPSGRSSTWAAASLLCSIALCCPLMPIISVLLGLRAMVELNANPVLRGRGMAKAGILIGLLSAVGWIGGAVWWHFNARLPMLHGPNSELRAGLDGDVAAFRAGFADHAATEPEAAAFLREVSARYGRFVDSQQNLASATKSSLSGPAELRVPYTLQFEVITVEAEAVFITFAPARVIPRPVFKWRFIRIIDPQRGDLVYPLSAMDEAKTQASPPP